MAIPSAMTLIGVWDPASRSPPHRRLGDLLASIEGSMAIAHDTLGARNRRLLALHRALIGGTIEARVTCSHCSAPSEFALPSDAILAQPVADPEARVRLRVGRRSLSFRLPRMSDIEAARTAPEGDIQRVVLERCCLGEGALAGDVAARLAARFEALDPAANVVVNTTCSGCAQPIAASVDIATFVAQDLDRLVEGLFRDVDVIASAYGWSEQEILSLPPGRRRRYVALIAAARQPTRLGLAERRA
jgi:hypothetical protein